LRAKNTPKSTRHKAAPKGSSITCKNPPFINSEEAPKTVSDPNQVANKAAALSIIGKLLPANIKSPDDFTLLEAQAPTKMVKARYKMIEIKSNVYSVPTKIELLLGETNIISVSLAEKNG
jgi:hypothetical protein